MGDFVNSPYKHDLLNDLFLDSIIFNKKNDGYFVEIGASNGYINSQSYFFEKTRNWNGICVEPNPTVYDELKLIRQCNIETSAILDVNNKIKFVIRETPEWSHIEGNNLFIDKFSKKINTIEINTLTLKSLLDKFNSPEEIDFISIDAEESEIKILDKFFNENTDYKINCFLIESGDLNALNYLFKDKPYVKVTNPYLNYLKLNPTNYEIIRFHNDNLYYTMTGNVYDKNPLELLNIEHEHYFIHIDCLNSNILLKSLIK